jgi:hypothetical protein
MYNSFTKYGLTKITPTARAVLHYQPQNRHFFLDSKTTRGDI